MLRLGMNKVFIGMLITAGALIFTLFRAVIINIIFRIQNNINNKYLKINGKDIY